MSGNLICKILDGTLFLHSNYFTWLVLTCLILQQGRSRKIWKFGEGLDILLFFASIRAKIWGSPRFDAPLQCCGLPYPELLKRGYLKLDNSM